LAVYEQTGGALTGGEQSVVSASRGARCMPASPCKGRA